MLKNVKSWSKKCGNLAGVASLVPKLRTTILRIDITIEVVPTCSSVQLDFFCGSFLPQRLDSDSGPGLTLLLVLLLGRAPTGSLSVH